MRSAFPNPADPWPHDMVITIDDPNQLTELLWIREAWDLEIEMTDAPPPLVDRPAPPRPEQRTAADADGSLSAWARAWPDVWAKVVGHAGGIRDPRDADALFRTANASAERAALLLRLVGPTWRDQVGESALDDRRFAWNQRAFERNHSNRPTSLDEQPERMALDALVPAWRAGLEKVVTIPCVGEYTRRIGDHVLLVTDATREDPRSYALALRSFAGSGS